MIKTSNYNWAARIKKNSGFISNEVTASTITVETAHSEG